MERRSQTGINVARPLLFLALSLGLILGLSACGGGGDNFTKGQKYFYQRQYELAVSEYTKAIDLDPSLTLAYLGRGIVYVMLGESSKANQDFAKACELDSSLCD